jgi:lysine-N-methylase
LPQNKVFQPAYSDDFRCIGPACEDSCCEEWTVHVDQGTFEKYQNLPAGPLRTLLDENVLRIPEPAQASGGAAAAAFAQIRMDSNRKCPLLTADGLCRIQVEHGEEFLPHSCATYPRVTYCIDGATEKALSLSCPEAARLVLLNPQLNTGARQDGGLRPGADHTHEGGPGLSYFWSIRNAALALVASTHSGSACFCLTCSAGDSMPSRRTSVRKRYRCFWPTLKPLPPPANCKPA